MAPLARVSAQTGAAASGSAYKAPRTPLGQPDLQGYWQVVNSAASNLEAHAGRLGVAPPGMSVVEGGDIPYKPEALAQRQKNFQNRATLDPVSKCWAPGIPRLMYMPHPFQIVQAATEIVLFFEFNNHERWIYMQGKHPEDIPFWLGDARGKFEGDTLVVDNANFNGETWLDAAGNYTSDALHVVERYTRTGPDHLTYEATITDPKVYSRPWKVTMPMYRRLDKNMQIMEYNCFEDLMLDRFYPNRP